MHSFGRYCAAVIVVLASLDVCAQADLKVGTAPVRRSAVICPGSAAAGVPTVKSAAGARYEVLLEQEQRVSQSAGVDCRGFPRGHQPLLELRPALPYERLRGQRALAGRHSFGAGVRAVQSGARQIPRGPAFSVAARSVSAQPAAGQGGDRKSNSSRRLPRRQPRPPLLQVADTTIRAVHREVLAEVVRVTLELDREVPFYQERLEGPARVFFDLKGTKTVPSLVDATFRYDSDIIRHIRLGRHPNNTTRVVLDLENVSRFSVFTLYNPYRIVIDAERSAAIAPKPAGPTLLIARIFAARTVARSRDWHPSSVLRLQHPLRSHHAPSRTCRRAGGGHRTRRGCSAGRSSTSAAPARGQARGADSAHAADSHRRPRAAAANAPVHPTPCPGCDRRRGHRGQTDRAVRQFERKVFGCAPAGTRRLADRDRRRSWRPRPRRVGVRHFRG